MLLEVKSPQAVREANRALGRGEEVVRLTGKGAEERLGLYRGALLWDESFLWGLFCLKALKRLNFPVEVVSARDAAEGALGSFDLVVVPGGWASQKSNALGAGGRDALKSFVEEGGGYLGFCGGAGLALRVGEGLALVPAARKPFDERLPNFSGGVMIHPGPGDHPMWEGVAAPGEVKVWWPSQFDLLEPSKIKVLAAYREPARDFFTSDIEVSRINETGGGFGELESEYGINLDPAVIAGEPAVISARCGRGRVVLSYPHLDTPEDGPWSVMLFNLWQHLGRAAGQRSALGSPGTRKEPLPPDPEAIKRAARLFEGVKGLIELGEKRGLWRFRNRWLMIWRRGVRGSEFNTLYVLLRELAALLKERGAPGALAQLRTVEARLGPFFREAGALIDAGGTSGWEPLVGPFPGHGTGFMEILREIDSLVFALVEGGQSE